MPEQEGEALLDELSRRLAKIAGIPPSNINGFKYWCEFFLREALRARAATEEAFAGDELKGFMDDALCLRKRVARLTAASTKSELDALGLARQYLGAGRSGVYDHDEFLSRAETLTQLLSDWAADAKAGKRALRGSRNQHRDAHQLITGLE